MNLIKADQAANWGVSVHVMNINEVALTRPQHCPRTTLSSVGCPMGGLEYVDFDQHHY